MPTFEEILKEVGLTDEERSALSPKVREAFESQYNKVASERDEAVNRFSTREKEWEDIKENVWNTKLRGLEEQVVGARREAADLREQVAIAAEWNLFPDKKLDTSAPPAVSKGTDSSAPFDPKAHKLVTYDDAARIAEMEARGICRTTDLALEYKRLMGQDLIEYENNGMRGLEALYEEAQRSGSKDLRQYVSTKFKFDEKRAEMKAKAQAEYDAKLRAEGRAEAAKEYSVNPNLRGPSVSKQPWMPPKQGESKTPWEKPVGQLAAERKQRALESMLTNKVN